MKGADAFFWRAEGGAGVARTRGTETWKNASVAGANSWMGQTKGLLIEDARANERAAHVVVDGEREVKRHHWGQSRGYFRSRLCVPMSFAAESPTEQGRYISRSLELRVLPAHPRIVQCTRVVSSRRGTSQ